MSQYFSMILNIAGALTLMGVIIGGCGLQKYTGKSQEVDAKATRWISNGAKFCISAIGVACVWVIMSALKFYGII